MPLVCLLLGVPASKKCPIRKRFVELCKAERTYSTAGVFACPAFAVIEESERLA
jgi:hypothetical protein